MSSAWKKAMEAAERRSQALWSKGGGLSSDILTFPHCFRPLRESIRKLDHAARAAGVPACQVMVVPNAKIVYDPHTEVPIRLLDVPPYRYRLLKGGWQGNFIHSDTAEYEAHRLFKSVYELVRCEDDPPAFEECTSGNAMLDTFRKVGSFVALCQGSCLVRRKTQHFVVVDSAYRVKLVMDGLLRLTGERCIWYADRTTTFDLWKYNVCGTCLTVVAIPLAAFRAGEGKGYSFTPAKKPDMFDVELLGGLDDAPPDFVKWFEVGCERGQGEVVVAPEFGEVKVAVEIDRRILGEPNIILFEPPEVADDPERVMQRLRALKLHRSCSSLGLTLTKMRKYPLRLHPRFYALLPQSVDEQDLPFRWYV